MEADAAIGSGSRRAAAAWERRDVGLIALAMVASLVLRPLPAIFTRSLWTDETWVAVLTRVPLSHLWRLSSSSPIGWLALLRAVPGSNPERFRFLTVACAAGAVVAAYVLVRSCAWSSALHARVAASVAAVLVAATPAMLMRDDVKQYVSDALVALVVLGAVRSIDADPRDWRVLRLGCISALALPFSTTSAFVGVAAFGALGVSATLRRAWRRAAATTVVGVAVGGFYAAFFGAVVAPNVNTSLHDYWHNAYLHGSPTDMLVESWHRLDDLAFFLAMPAAVAVGLFAIGITALVRQRETALAVTLPMLWLEMMALGRAQLYPFLELRTSLFLIVPSLVIVGIGATSLCMTLLMRRRALAVACGTVLAVMFAIGAAPTVHAFGIPNEDIRGQTRYVASHIRPDDVVIVNALASWGFAYYWPRGHIHIVRTDGVPPGFLAEVPDINAQYATGTTYEQVLATLRAALQQGSAARTGQMFVVRTHMNGEERDAWTRAFATLHLQPRDIRTGVEPLAVIRPPTFVAQGSP
ncbi:MAG TPA: hypothetical protein VEZ15_09835 [Acidimicrobiia bacterium]|nr:hypothetical protein [Acidimicrobiia bacterium]